MTVERSYYSAAEQGLGYMYQPRLALLRLLELPESSAVFLEKEDDLEFVSDGGRRSLQSLKHKAQGERITDLSLDFWKSVGIWLGYYTENGRIACDGQFILLSTANLSKASVLCQFVSDPDTRQVDVGMVMAALSESNSQPLKVVYSRLSSLTDEERLDFFARVQIIDSSPRITDLPSLIDRKLRTVRRDARQAVFERLEGWWNNLAIALLAGDRSEPIHGYELSDKLSAVAEEYRSDNLPITFRGKMPEGEIDPASDPRLFVEQLRALDLSASRIQNAIVDYYRAFEQRSSWARENLLISGEIEEYEDRLIEEWSHYRAIVFEGFADDSDEIACQSAGKELYRWAEMETSALRIRERVTEPYVVRGAFQMLANASPVPRVHWHPHFLERLKKVLGLAA